MCAGRLMIGEVGGDGEDGEGGGFGWWESLKRNAQNG